MRLFFILFLSTILLAGCAAPASRWRDEAFNSFNAAVTAGSQQSAPEETETIRQTLALADRYFTSSLRDDAERLYQLSYRQSQLLHRNLVLSNVSRGSLPGQQHDPVKHREETVIASDTFSTHEKDPGPTNTSTVPSVEAGQQKSHAANTTAPVHASNGTPVSPSVIKPEKNMLSRRITTFKQVKPDRPILYLTFDDGPSRITLPIARFLNSQGIAATFFALGSSIKGHEKVVSDTVALGHRVGNHTLSHDLRKLNYSLRHGVNEIGKTAVMLEALGGDGKMVRIPYGAASEILISAVAAEGGQIFDWDIDSLDTSKRGVKNHAFIEQTVMNRLQESGKRHIVMLFHDGAGHDATLAAIRNLVPRLKQAGYRFGLLSRNDRVAQSRMERNPMP